MDIHNTTVLTKELQMGFSKSYFWKDQKKRIIICEIVLAVAIALILGFYIEKYWIAIALGVLMIAFPIGLIILLDSGLKKSFNDPQDQHDDLTVDFVFHDVVMDVTIRDQQGLEQKMCQAYNCFAQILETKDLLVFMLADQQAFFVGKTGFLSTEDYDRLESLVKVMPNYKKL